MRHVLTLTPERRVELSDTLAYRLQTELDAKQFQRKTAEREARRFDTTPAALTGFNDLASAGDRLAPARDVSLAEGGWYRTRIERLAYFSGVEAAREGAWPDANPYAIDDPDGLHAIWLEGFTPPEEGDDYPARWA